MKKGLVVTILGLLVVLLMRSFPAEASVRKLPSFRLYTLRGEEIPFRPPSLAILFFLDPECLFCLAELVKLYERTEDLGGKVLLYPVCLRCDFRDAKRLEDSLGGKHTIYLAHPLLPALLGIWETPVLFLVNTEGRVLYQAKGEIAWDDLQSLLSAKNNERGPSRQKKDSCVIGLCS
ncbi:TlpA family protein disulfide reductase [Candidatus Caldatribacterium sp. SIUC1]|uniref:TlpA family protein disulfide reductase n=1 Tax=Candidatus Caldatribacterium sp. SIUC1 TaxID=3418365 RepID=UPI003F68C658